MTATPIPAPGDPRLLVTIVVAVKGRRSPLTLKIPRSDFIDESVVDEIDATIEKIVEDQALSFRKKQRAISLAKLEPLVPEKDYAVCETLALGQLDAIIAAWGEKSAITLGEFLASADSSTENTEAPSSTTSTSADTPEGTLDVA